MSGREWLNSQARQRRSALISAEMLVWSRVRARRLAGYKFRREHVIGRYIVDFYCAEKRLAIEIDGPTHDPARDQRRDRMLAAQGIAVLRIDNKQVFRDPHEILGWILDALEAQPSYARRDGRTRIPRT